MSPSPGKRPWTLSGHLRWPSAAAAPPTLLAFRPARRSAPAALRGAEGSTRAPPLAASDLDPEAADPPSDLGQVTAPLGASPSRSVKWGCYEGRFSGTVLVKLSAQGLTPSRRS